MKRTLILLMVFIPWLGNTQERQDSELFKQLKAADSLLFERGFNRCDYDALEKLVHNDLQFLHDQGGMQNRREFFKAVQDNICNGKGGKPMRKLIGELLVYPLHNNGTLYGAIQLGDHEFYTLENGQPSRQTTLAKFIHTWLFENGQWRLYRVMSYDHKPR